MYTTLTDLPLEELGLKKNAKVQRNIADFTILEPLSIKNSLSPRYTDSYDDNTKSATSFHDLNSSKTPLRAGFDDFDGVSGNSLTSKDTLDLPFTHASITSLKSSPYSNEKHSLPGNASQASSVQSTSSRIRLSQHNIFESPLRMTKTLLQGTPLKDLKKPQVPLLNNEANETSSIHAEFPSVESVIDDDPETPINDQNSHSDYVNKPETLKNGYISATST